jgi:hypothetical protein
MKIFEIISFMLLMFLTSFKFAFSKKDPDETKSFIFSTVCLVVIICLT